jgi:hypothetical protein
VKTLNVRIVRAALIGFALLPSSALAQAQPVASVTRLVPLNITGHYVVPAIKPAANPARYELLTADPFKDVSAAVVTPVIVARKLSVACVAALICPLAPSARVA